MTGEILWEKGLAHFFTISEILDFSFYSCFAGFSSAQKKPQTVLCFCLSQPHQRVQQGK